MSTGTFTLAEAMTTAIEQWGRAPLVTLDEDGFFHLHHDGRDVYDFKAEDAAQVVRWTEHLARKSWVTKEHLLQFASLAAQHFGVRHL
jgi:hypothetical protein